MSGVAPGRIMQIAVTVSDLDRSVAFYRDQLGMAFLFNAGTMAFLQCREVRLLLGTPEPGKPISNGGTILYLKSDDLKGDYARLTDAGSPSVQAPQMIAKMPDHDLWLAIVSDPDGNPVGLMSEIARTA
ncbi:methylmalonyl-CoA/ethylmalonyl-CoA epimerase [Granulicella aggregans]|uniref:Methylmalonyl-CoA/ethylmalonyl-CoA epimerase n=1 Tax=Granulicella aggregans TaxID=474949 RepID=A0A7W8E333_9BACT|nr:VOC family protein [Granulicella aggregans]MBB5057016.1 methylmalonyl-CoA/ethylmalonyl-CoA epimerase [Granulicella aggregans]